MKKIKEILAAVTAGVICIAGVPLSGMLETVSAAGYTKGTYGELTYYNYGTYISITDCDTSATAVSIPMHIGGVSVTSIASNAFSDCTVLASVTIPKNVTSIGDSAFSECTSLTAVTIPNSVIEVGGGLFYGCSALQSVVLSNQITKLPSYGDNSFGFFENCTSLKKVTMDGVVTIYPYAFRNCPSLTEITIPNSVTTICSCAFKDCTGLTSITISDSVTFIGKEAFGYCISLNDVYYTGTETEWNAIEVRTYNEQLLNAVIHFNSIITTAAGSSSAGKTTTTTKSAVTTFSKGDLDGDGTISILDAYSALLAYSKISAGLDSGLTKARITAADVDGDGKLTINDAYKILLYYATKSAGGNPSWD